MDSRPFRPTCRDDFEIAIITALPLEYDAVADIFDGFWNDDGDIYGRAEGDQNTYTTGWIGQHNVVLAICSDIGKVNATSVAASCSASFTRIRLAFLVGVCGVVPQTSNGDEIVLGDVIIGDRVVPYDIGRRFPDGMKLESDRFPCNTSGKSHTLRRFMATMQTVRYRGLVSKRAREHMRMAQDGSPDKYRSLIPSEDRLFPPEYRHKHQVPGDCQTCYSCTAASEPVCLIALTSTCEDLGCDEGRLVPRQRLAVNQSLEVHWGTFASADSVLKSAEDRDWIARKHEAIGFEMEATGICDIFPCIIIKGACDYADAHKNKKWQNYAAITAACVMKALLQWYPKTDQRITPSSLKALSRLERELPPHVYFTDLVTVNDALGETYRFSISLIDSLEV